MDTIANEVQGFFERYPSARNLGKITTLAEIEALPENVRSAIPGWYKELLLQFPIARLPLGIPNDFGQPLFKGRAPEKLPLMEITFYSVDEIVRMSDTIFPNYLLFRKKKIIGIGEDQGSTGEGIFIDSNQANPPVTMVFHDMGESVNALLKNGERLVDKFSDLFKFGKLRNDKIKLTGQNRKVAIDMITLFFKWVDEEIAQNKNKLAKELPEFNRLTEGMEQRDIEVKNDEYVSALLRFEWGLEDSGYPLTKKHLENLVALYTTCGLHIPELAFIEEKVGNSGSSI
jgi:hypothetical protein